jgi:Secretion system C-terminal sorting domain
MPAGSYEYKFLNGKAWGTDEKAQGACATTGGNRKITVAAVDTKLDTVCFNYCVSCKKVLYTNDVDFSNAMNVYPNPAQNEVNLQYKFDETTNLNVNVVNALGQIIYSAKMPNIEAGTATLNVNNLTNGVYMIQITDDKQHQSVKRLMIQK